MKNILRTVAIAIIALFTGIQANAQVITAERAGEIAKQFFANGKQKAAAYRSTNVALTQSADSRAITGNSDEAPTYHIFTGTNGKGFVIVSGEETENPIIGYSFDGTIDTNNLPDGFVDYMSDIDAQVRALREYNAANPQKAAAARSAMQKAADYEYNATSMGEIVVDLKTAPWGQQGPFNKLCPIVGTGNAVTGCVPTAYSILCRYYEWPEQGVGTVYNPSTEEPLQLGHTYEYASMRNDNYRSGYTDAEATAVATLMRDMGYAYTASYGSGTTTTSSENPQNLITYFGFKCETPLDHGGGCTKYDIVNNMEQWVTYIKNCLNSGYPIPYSSTTALNAQDRHIYILDGYTDNNYFHFNWGWGGQGNGWFTLDNMVPDNSSNYSKSHRAYFNVIPNKTTYPVTATANPSNMGTVSINGGTAGSTATANLIQGATATLVAHPANDYALASWTKNGVIVGSKNTLQVPVGTDNNDYVANFADESTITIVKDYTISSTTGELSNDGSSASKFSQWASTEEPVLRLNATCGSTAANSMSIVNNVLQLYAYDYDKASGYTYTINAPDGYLITSYSLTYYMSSSFNITVSNGTTTQTASKSDQTLSASDLSTESTSFTLTGTAANNLVKVSSFTVTIQKEGANVGGGSTPATTYTIYATAGAGGSVTINDEAVSQKSVNENSTVKVVAIPNTGYRFVSWTSGTSTTVSTNATYSFTATANTSLVANFEKADYTVTVAAGEGGVAYIGTKGTTSTTVDYNTNLTITAEANDGYEFVEWRAYDSHFTSNAQQNVTVTTDVTYTAVFRSTTQQGTTSLAGKYFRLKEKSTGTYMNIYDNISHGTEARGGVNVTTKDESNDAQIFQFIESGTNYKLQSKTGYYIYCQSWNVDAYSTTSANGTELTLEPTATELEYLINCAKGYFKIDPVDGNASLGNFVYCNANNGSNGYAATWVLEEVIPSNEKTLNVTFGELWSASEVSQIVTKDSPAITITEVNGANKVGYSTKNDGKHPFLLKGGQFTISVPAPYKIASYTLVAEYVSFNAGTVEYTNGRESTATATISNGAPSTLSATGLNNSEICINLGNATASPAGLIITSLAITYVEEEFTPLPFKAEIDGWRDNNPNTHLGTITIGGTPMKLTPEHLTASELTMPLNAGSALAFTRKYRGFNFNGFYIGETELGTNPTLTADYVAAINETTPLVAKFTATDDVTLFYDDDEFSYRIPAIVKTGTNRLVAISDYRHSHDDIGRDQHGTGTNRVDLVMRTSDDNGATWSAKQTIAEGTSTFGYGDAAIVANGQDILVMAVAGNVFYPQATATNKNKTYRIYSNNNGQSWTKEEVTSNIFGLFDEAYATFFGSGKLAVDPDFNGTGKARVYGAILLKNSARSTNNYVLFSDDWGATWNILGGSKTQIAEADEPKVEILPNGQILLSSRHASGGSRVFNVFTYGNDKAAGEGTWGTAVSGCSNGGSNGTNGEIICLDAKKTNGELTKILLQSQPQGGSSTWDRKDVTIWYKEIGNETQTASSIANGWTKGLQVSTVQSAYSAMALQENGKIAFFFEEAPCHNDNNTYGYSMVYVPLTIEEITNNNFLNPNAVVETVTVDVTLTDEQGNTYTHQFNYLPGDAAAIDAALTTAYPFITLGAEGNLQGSGTAYTYTNTVTLPFKVSNADTTVWHNIYWPANTGNNGYPVYLSASSATDTYVPKVTEAKVYGESSYNTLQNGDKIAWAIYNVNNSFEFIFKNKLTNNYIKAESVATDGAQNVKYVAENNATAFTLLKDTGTRKGDYALVAKVDETIGYLCSTSATGYHYATHYNGNSHEGAWVVFKEAPDYQAIVDELTANIAKFGDGEGNYTANDDIDAIEAIIEDIETTPLNTLNTHTTTVQTVKDSYTEITLTVPAVNDVVPGSVKILDETVSHKFVPKGEVTIKAVPADGYYFVNWTRPAAAASAAARTAEARNSNFVSDQNPYTVTVSEALSLEANFEEIVANVTLNDEQGNTYNVTLRGLTGEVNAETLETMLMAEYPFIEEFGGTPTFVDNNTSYTYSNIVKLKFKVSNTENPNSDDLWHNIYYPSNGGNPNYIAAFDNNDEIVGMAASGGYIYGDNPTYNTTEGNPKISWAIYNVNNSFEFIFKNELTKKYIKAESVENATGNTQNVRFVDNAGDATAFTLLKDTGTYNGDYALVATVEETTGYLCATSSSTNYVTHFDRNNHQGAWVKIEEADYGELISILDNKLLNFDYGNGKYMLTTEIQEIIDAIGTFENPLYLTMTLNNIKSNIETALRALEEWKEISLTITPENCGTTSIAGEANITNKFVPAGPLTITATPAEGYHFVKWTNGTSDVSSDAEYTFDVQSATTLTANFAKNSYTISVTAGEGGSAIIGTETSATVEHGSEVTLTATASAGYSFVNWTKGTDVVSTNATYTFPVTADGEYVANFELSNTPVRYYTVSIETEGLSNDKFAAYINTGTTQNETAKDYEPGSTVRLIAIQDNSNVGSYGYAFVGWYLNETLVDINEEIEFNITSNVTYTAKFVEGIRISTRAERGWPHIYLYENDKEVGGTSMSTILVPGRRLKLSVTPEYGCRFTHWVVGEEVVSTDNPFTTEPLNEAVTFKAICEPAYYNLTVRSNSATAGKVTVNSNESSSEMTVKVGHNTDATITATPNDGFKFVNWTKGTDVVSTNATYTIAAIDAIEDLEDVEYIANFIEDEEAEPGVYYRFAYEFPAAAAASAARTGATRAAGEQTITLLTTGELGGIRSNSKNSEWNSDYLSMHATGGDGSNPVYAIYKSGTSYFRLSGYTNDANSNTYNKIKYTLSAKEGYVITSCSFSYTQKIAGAVTINYNGVTENSNDVSSHDWAITPNAQTVEITLSTTTNNSNNYLTVRNFTVTIQEVGSGEGEGGEGGDVGGGETPETPETPATVKYYIQSETCGVTNKTNALLMTTDGESASSIFYYAENKLLSYSKGRYVKEDGDTRGLQSVGTSGKATISIDGETATIATPSYMHAANSGTTYFVDHCGSNNGDPEHNFIIEEVTALPVTISSAKHATLFAPVALEIPDGIKAYILKSENIKAAGDYATMTRLTQNIIPANTGVILKSEEAKTYNFNIVENTDEARAEVINNILAGTVAETTINKDAYILAVRNSLIGLYPLSNNSYITGGTTATFTNNSHKAYLPVEGEFGEILKKSNGFRFFFDDGNVTDIEEVETEVEETIYDLQGRKLSEITEPGIYIVNGKKIFVK